jgi:hypothetical protein
MIPIQAILLIVFVAATALYFRRFRFKIWDRLIILMVCATGAVAVLNPDLANAMAHRLGVGRGADLFFYLTVPGLGVIAMLLFSRIRELEARQTMLVREIAILRSDLIERE